MHSAAGKTKVPSIVAKVRLNCEHVLPPLETPAQPPAREPGLSAGHGML